MDYKRLLKVIAVIAVLPVTAYFTYSYFSNNDPKEIPIIEADSGETKIKPLDAGGIILPHTDSFIYENMGKTLARKITILPEPEQALPLAAQKNSDNEFENSIDSMLASVIAPDKAVSEPVEEDQIAESVFEDTRSIEHEELSIPETASNNPTNVKTLNIVKVTENSNKRIGEIKSSAGIQKGSYKIQLASMKSEALAIAEGERIKRKHLKVLGNSVITHKKVQQGKGEFFYIILAGDYSTLSKAKAACKKLSARQQSCMIYQP